MFQYLLFLILFLLSGCKEEFPTYSSFCSQSQNTFSCLHYAILEDNDKKILKETFNIKENKNCPFRVELTKYHVGNCNNPLVKSLGGDFNGYVRIEIKKGFKCYYKVQSDYKNDEYAAFERVLYRVEKEINSVK